MDGIEQLRRYNTALQSLLKLVNAITEERDYYRELAKDKEDA